MSLKSYKFLARQRLEPPDLLLENRVLLPTVPWEPLEHLTNVSEMTKIFGATETRTTDLLLENRVVLTLLLSFTFE